MNAPPNKVILTEEQEAYLRDNFPTVINYTLCKYLGIGERTLIRLARERGYVKDMAAISGQKGQRISEALRKSKAMKGRPHTCIKNGAKTRFQPGYKAKELFGEEKFRKMHQKGAETRKKRFADDVIRYKWGLPQLTKMRVCKQPRQKILDRSYLKRRGYIIDNANNVAYYTDETRRATRLESKPRYFKFLPYKETS